MKNDPLDSIECPEKSAAKSKKQKTKSVTKSVTKPKDDRKAIRTTQKKTVLIDRASEALEKLTNAYRAVNVAALEHVKEIQRPSKH